MKKYFIYLNSIVAKSTFAAAISTVTFRKTMDMLSGAGMIVQSLIDQGVLHTVRGLRPRYRIGSGGLTIEEVTSSVVVTKHKILHHQAWMPDKNMKIKI